MLNRLALVLVVAALLAGCSPRASAPSPAASAGQVTAETLNAQEFAAYSKGSGVVLLDVRTPAEFAGGHLQGARNIDVNGADFDAAIGALSRDATYAVYCRSGNRSAQALARMKSLGFTRAAHLDGGIGAWQRAGYAIVR